MKRRALAVLGSLLLAASGAAADGGPGYPAKGLAVVHVKSKHAGDMELQQAVFLGADGARFVGLDDFGGIPFVISVGKEGLEIALPDGSVTAKGKKLKRLLSLPLTQDEFLSILRHEKPAVFQETADADGEASRWTDPKRKDLSIYFSDFMRGPVEPSYPRRIVVQYKKSLFDLKWQNLDFQTQSSSH